mgnify:CR=1 FL=1
MALRARFYERLLLGAKKYPEWAHQKQWAEEFASRENYEKVLDYWKRYRHLDEIVRITTLSRQSRILDVGCDISTVLHYIPGHRVGLDPLARRYRRVHEYPDGISVVSGSAQDIPFPDASFDVVFCTNALDHCASPASAVAEMRRVLKPAGFVVLTVEVFSAPSEARNAAHPNSFTRESLLDLLQGIEYKLCKESPWYGLREYCLGRSPTQERELVFVGQTPS